MIQATVGVSAATAPLDERDIADLQRYIDVNRAELFFARGVVLVEGEAERFLVPAFATALDMPLDRLGISVCSVGGVNFGPYVKLLSPRNLDIPHVVLTDLDPNDDRPAQAVRRINRLLNPTAETTVAPDNNDDLFDRAEQRGYFVNDSTLELELFHAGMGTAMLTVMESELGPSQDRRVAFQNWIADPDALDAESLLGWIERIGKGRFAQTLCAFVTPETCPPYIRRALERLRDAVS